MAHPVRFQASLLSRQAAPAASPSRQPFNAGNQVNPDALRTAPSGTALAGQLTYVRVTAAQGRENARIAAYNSLKSKGMLPGQLADVQRMATEPALKSASHPAEELPSKVKRGTASQAQLAPASIPLSPELLSAVEKVLQEQRMQQPAGHIDNSKIQETIKGVERKMSEEMEKALRQIDDVKTHTSSASRGRQSIFGALMEFVSEGLFGPEDTKVRPGA